MIRKIALAGAGAAIALAGVAALAGPASAGSVTLTSIDSASIQCNIAPTKASIVPALKNNWVKANHNGINDVGPAAAGADPVRQETGVGATWNDTETNPYVKALPDTKYSTDGANSVSSKSKTASCTGSVTKTGVGTFPVVSLKITLGNDVPGVDNPPLNTDNTCQGLLAGNPAGDTAATYKATITPKLTGAKMALSTTTGLALVAGGGGNIGFEISGGTTTGPLAGSNSKTTAFVSGDVLTAVGQTPSTSAAPAPANKLGSQCEASLKVKADKPGKPGTGSATLKGPKGLKKILVGNNILPPNQASNICIKKGSSC
jgi:hypothetical protein